ncbi:MAG: polymer-forming cytoskeletal protein [Haloferacaceae archaeon]
MRRVPPASLVLVPALALALTLALLVGPGVVAAESRAGAGVSVAPDERTGDLTATGGAVEVYGVVDGDLEAYGGRVVIAENATVTGDVNAYAGVVRIEGTVEGQVVAYGGRVVETPTASVGESLGAVTGLARIGGRVRGDVIGIAGRVRLDPTATVGGDVNYEGALSAAPDARVDGRVRRLRDFGIGPAPPSGSSPALFVYGLLGNLVLGALLLSGVDGFSQSVVERAVLDPLSSLGLGVAAAVAAPLLVVALVLSLVGLPVGVVLALSLPAVGWIGAVYGRFAVGAWLLSYTEVETPWAGLALGVVLVGLLGLVPYAGPALRGAVFALGAGALVAELRDRIGESGQY